MKSLYLDLLSGISGDMFLGGLLDLGVPLDAVERGLEQLPLHGFHVHAGRDQRAGVTGVRFEVHLEPPADHPHGHPHPHLHGVGHTPPGVEPHPHSHPHPHRHPGTPGVVPGPSALTAPRKANAHDCRNFADIQRLIQDGSLSDWVKARAIAVFRRLAQAEGKIHGVAPEDVHFHEVGAVDSIVDIVGGCLALDLLGRPRVLASAVTDGHGWVHCAHGRFPIPAPATVEVLAARGVALSQCDEPHELVTPTGAALLAEFAESFEPLSGFRVERVGYGVGGRDLGSRPNVLRILLGEAVASTTPPAHDWESDTVAVLETNLDDTNPEFLGHFAQEALAAGALDVFFTPVHMKKGRPAVLLTVLSTPPDADRFTERLLRETGAFGVRRTLTDRRKLRREFRTVETPSGSVVVKVGLLDGEVVQAAPEYESCRQLAARTGRTLRRVYEETLQAFGRLPPGGAAQNSPGSPPA